MQKIIVFGATGDIGHYFIQYLLEKKVNTYFDLIATGRKAKENWICPQVDYIQLDIQDSDSFSSLPQENIYAVVDLAGIMPARMEGFSPYPYININILGTLNILEYCRKTKTDRILFSQSFGDIKDNAEKEILLKPMMQPNFSYHSDHSEYVISKNTAVQLIEVYHQKYDIKRFIFRLPTIYLYSPIDSYYVDGKIHKIGYRIIIDNAIQGKDVEVWGDSTRKKDMVYVKDFCQMLYLALFTSRSEGYYNVGTGIGTTLEDQIKGIVSVFGDKNKSHIYFCPQKQNAPQYIMDISNAQRELGYEPRWLFPGWLYDFKDEMIKN